MSRESKMYVLPSIFSCGGKNIAESKGTNQQMVSGFQTSFLFFFCPASKAPINRPHPQRRWMKHNWPNLAFTPFLNSAAFYITVKWCYSCISDLSHGITLIMCFCFSTRHIKYATSFVCFISGYFHHNGVLLPSVHAVQHASKTCQLVYPPVSQPPWHKCETKLRFRGLSGWKQSPSHWACVWWHPPECCI